MRTHRRNCKFGTPSLLGHHMPAEFSSSRAPPPSQSTVCTHPSNVVLRSPNNKAGSYLTKPAPQIPQQTASTAQPTPSRKCPNAFSPSCLSLHLLICFGDRSCANLRRDRSIYSVEKKRYFDEIFSTL